MDGSNHNNNKAAETTGADGDLISASPPDTPVLDHTRRPSQSSTATIATSLPSPINKDTVVDNDSAEKNKVDPESGMAVVQEQTAEEILAQEVKTLPMRQLAPAFLGVALTMFMAALDNSIVSTALPRIGTEFKASNQVELVFTCYVITFNAFQGLYGKMSNVFGRKPVVFFAIIVFVVGSILSGASQSMNMFLACRALTGVGAGGIFSLSNIIIADLVSIRDRGKFQGFISAVFGLSALIGPVMGGAFVDKVSWRWCFWIEVAFAVITIPTLAVMLKLPRPKGSVWEKLKGIDWAGTFFMAITALFLLLPTNLGGNLFAWDSPLVITMYALAVPSILIFLFIEAKHAVNPIVPPYLWRNRNVVTLFAINIFMGMTFWSLIFYLPIYFQIIEHETATAAGLTMIPLEAGIFIASNVAGILVSKFGKYRPYIFTGTGIAVVGICLCLVLANTSSKVIHVVILFVCGIGIGQLFPCLIVAIQASVERKDLATVSALHNFFRMTGSGFGVAINGALFQNNLNNGLARSNVPEQWTLLAKSSAQKIVEIPLEYRGEVEEIYLSSMKTVFKAMIPMAALMFLLTFRLQHVRLNVKKTSEAEKGEEGKADADDDDEVEIVTEGKSELKIKDKVVEAENEKNSKN
ncbi:hypothetical protein BG011_007673 [Mortierella polycephala]|uniref:Major facilitator superfamily (MFS) profile domain-containing protein n=1 Tax=Mortierella polycephala TaxID=41804 RepID=A0A9P6QHF9_9FUNG|nr:hypothetical protein BG011_007673 [Mortierella polycephala]